MKKFVVALTMLVIAAGIASANYWNVNWKIYDAYSPLDLDGDYSPAVLDDFSVTWSLLYGDAVQVDPGTGQLVDGTYTLIDSMYAPAGGSLTWTFGTTTATYDKTLYATSGTTYTGSTDLTTAQTVYQHILLEKDSLKYFWISDGTSVVPSSVTTGEVWNLGETVSLGPDGTDADGRWTAVPEPTTMALLGLGGLAMVLRRRIRR